ncbi:EAL domain-containing protein [Geobacter sp. FeAm09]|uniref:two-component system response regulator n=1 Tax=Geobacter sp. FeAm09 TaxID=2597769 RepID=UPI0011ECB0F0|nr:EAL domain-containing protein [Geobacter sp. FeAm09]QEM67640.1 EAL domain-containing protein [Geobacter sp. FeAm09]
MNFFVQSTFNHAHDMADQTERILIVDDEPRMRSSLRQLLDGPGRDIVECGTGEDAIAILKDQNMGLVLLDIHLPGVSGLDVMEWITDFNAATRVIMVSADADIDSAIRALRSGAVEFIRKPYDLEEMQHKVDNALLRSRLERINTLMTTRLELSERMHRFLVESSPDLIYTLDTDGCFIFVNGRAESLLGYSRGELVGRHYTAIVREEDWDTARYAFTERRRDSRATTNVEVRLKCSDSRSFEPRFIVAVVSAMGVYEENGDGGGPLRFIGTYGVARDISERKKAEETISFQAMHDHLTHLPNRRLFKDRLELSMNQSKRNGRLVGVMFIDLDRFKLVNDTHGHAEGDELLVNVAHRLRNCVRAGDTLARQGGDEFTVLLPDLYRSEDACIIAEKVLDALKAPFQVKGQEFRATASIGIAVYPHDGDSADALLKNADIAMYKVKATGKNNYLLFTPEMNAGYHERIRLENELRQAIGNAEFELYYQPKISISGGKVVGLEALIRWRHPVHGLLNPASFIDLAEESGLICDITDWVLAEACSQMARWRDMGLNNLRISVNVSPSEFTHSDFLERIVCNITKNRLPADAVEIEITENLLLHDATGVIDKMRYLRNHGVGIAIDDFGTRYSSLNYLRKFPISAIKIDQSFVRDLTTETRVSPILNAIIGMARGFGLHLVAEGVETVFQMKTLNELGCDEMQGYLFSKPVPAAELRPVLLNALPNLPDRWHYGARMASPGMAATVGAPD